MPTYKGVEVWIEDSEYRKLDYQDESIDLVDDRTVTAKTEMLRDERYIVHCLSPVPVFCEVFVTTGSSASRVRNRAARFHLEKPLVISKVASGSTANHVEGRFRDHGLRTPKRTFQQGKLGTVEVEIRRIDEVIRGEIWGEREVDGDTTEFLMIDDFDLQPPWLVFRFDISAKEPLATLASATQHIKRQAPHMTLQNRTQATSGGQPRGIGAEGSKRKTFREKGYYGYLHNSGKHPRHDRSASIGENPKDANSDQLQKELQKEEVEERRLLQKLQGRLDAKRKRNVELRRLLGETL